MLDIIHSFLENAQLLPLPPSYRGLVPAIAVSFMALEYGLARLSSRHVHDARETAASLGIALGNAFFRTLEVGLLALPFAFVYKHRLFDIPLDTAWAMLALFFGAEFFYYLLHISYHNIRWMWATHAVHHTATRLNLTAAVRLGWTGILSGQFLFFLPMVWIGFHPLVVTGMLAVSLVYQFFVHTELAPHLGPLEWVLNTPRHHQVHHSSDSRCLDKNFGGILIIYDRMFGTFAERPQGELPYGLTEPLISHNPVWIAFHEWVHIARDVWQAQDWRGRWRAVAG
jgi:sterol desaturase/sphingolipid hydroxylase (fatty acid hydroxylase superfamily)